MKQQYIDYYKNLFRPQFRNVDENNFYLRSEAALNKMTAKKKKDIFINNLNALM